VEPNEFIDLSLAEFEKQLTKVINNFEKRLAIRLHKKLQLDADGNILKIPENLEYSTVVYNELMDELENSGYYNVVSALQAKDAELVKIISATSYIPLEFSQTGIETIEALRKAQMMAFRDIGEKACMAVREALMKSILTGQSIEQVHRQIRKELEDRLQRYSITYALTSRQEVMQMIHDAGAQNTPPQERYWVYVGPRDDKTRPACNALLDIKYFSNEEREYYEAMYAGERAYNCRHIFMQITKEDFDKKLPIKEYD
jgi:hypothetical protein